MTIANTIGSWYFISITFDFRLIAFVKKYDSDQMWCSTLEGELCSCRISKDENIPKIIKKTIRIFDPFSTVKFECLDQFWLSFQSWKNCNTWKTKQNKTQVDFTCKVPSFWYTNVQTKMWIGARKIGQAVFY